MQMNYTERVDAPKSVVSHDQVFQNLAKLPEGKYRLGSLQPWWKVWRCHNEGWVHVSVSTLGEVSVVVTPFSGIHLPLFKRYIFKFSRLGQFIAYYRGRGPEPQLTWLAALYDPVMYEAAARRAAWVWRHLDRQGIFDTQH